MMDRKCKMIGAAALLCLLAAFTFSCQRPPPEAGAASQSPAPQPDVMAADTGGVITFATYSFFGDAYQPILEEFHKLHPEITVQVRELPATMDLRQIASAADTTLLMFRAPNLGSYFLDLAPLEEGDLNFRPDSFWPGILDACRDAEGRFYGLPVFLEPSGIFYREEAFDAAGLPHPAPGWTWEDFQKAANSLRRTEDGQAVYGFSDDSFIDTPDETLLASHIGFLLGQTGGEIDVERFSQELQWYPGLAQSGGLYSANIYPQVSTLQSPENSEAWSKAWNESWAKFHEMFVKRPPAMWKGRLDQTYWADVELSAMPDGSLNMTSASGPIIESKEGIGWAPFPISADGQNDRTSPGAVTCAVISAGSEHPRSAWIWLNFLAAHPFLPEWSLAVPSQPAAAETSGYWGKIPEKYREAVRFGAEHGWYHNPYPEAALAVNQALLKAVAEKTDLRVALEEAGSQVETAALPTVDPRPIVVEPPDPTAAPSATSIKYFALLSRDGVRIKNLADEFQRQHPEVTVELASAVSMGGVAELADTYDCFSWLPETQQLPGEQLVDLDQFLAADAADLRGDFDPQDLEEYSQDGKLYTLPAVYRPNLIYYNADLLARRGLKPPAPDWTYVDFMDMINAATSSSEASPIYGFALEYPTPDVDLFLAGRSAPLVDSSAEVPAFLFDTPETRNSVQWLAEQVKAGVIFPVTPLEIGSHPANLIDARQLILDGHVAFWMSWYDQGQGGNYSLEEAKFSIGAAPIPIPDGAVAWRPHHLALGQYISRRAANPRACWDWIKFLSEQSDSSYGVPARRSVRESESWAAQVGQAASEVYRAALDQRRLSPAGRNYTLGLVRNGWNELLAEVLFGADPLPLLAELQAKADAYSACLALSGEYLSGIAQQQAQAEATCAGQANLE